MDIENDEKYYEFCIEIIKRLHLDRNNFFKEVANLRPYESLVFSWINLNYFEGFSIDDTIDYIYKARYMLYFKGLTKKLSNKKKGKLRWVALYNNIPPVLSKYNNKQFPVNKAS